MTHNTMSNDDSQSNPKTEIDEEEQKLENVRSKYFVSNLFVEKIFDNMTCSYNLRIEELEKIIRGHEQELEKIHTRLNTTLPPMMT